MWYQNLIQVDNPSVVRPTQDYLNSATFKHYLKSGLDFHPPIPVVHDPREKTMYPAIDGHHQLALSLVLGAAVSLWVVDSPRDVIPYNLFQNATPIVQDITPEIHARNEQIKRRFDIATVYVPSRSDGSDILTLDDLMDHAGIRDSLIALLQSKTYQADFRKNGK